MLVLAVTVAAPALSAAQGGADDPDAEPGGPPPTTPATPEPGAGEVPTEGPAETGTETQQVTGEITTETAAPEPDGAKEKQKLAKAAADKTVSIGDNFYRPETVSITVGDTVTWKNNGAAPHSATADDGSFDTGVFNGGQSRSETFTNVGTVPYFCTVHGQAQSGTIEVRSSGGGGGGSGGSGASSSGTSEAAAVASPGAAGSSSSLPATGFAAIALAAVGMALLGSGSVLRRLDVAGEAGRRRRARFFSL